MKIKWRCECGLEFWARRDKFNHDPWCPLCRRWPVAIDGPEREDFEK